MTARDALRNWIEGCTQEWEWRPGPGEEMRRWQEIVRAEIRKAIGIERFTVPKDLHCRSDGAVSCDGYTRERVSFDSRSGCVVEGYVLMPSDLQAPGPGVLCLPGHGVGVDAIVGLREEPYHADFALQCVRHGYPTLAIEQIGFGRRRSNEEFTSCHADSTTALMLGETVTGWRVWDAMRALDYLAARPEVDPGRLITMGISGGGLTSLWTAAIDERVHSAAVSGYFNTFRDSILSVSHCVDNFAPGVLRIIEMPDFAALVAPRRLFAESGTEDDLFPTAAFHRAVARAKEIYDAFGVPGRFGWESFEGDHHFHGDEMFRFLQRETSYA